jgi:hypothetical protein
VLLKARVTLGLGLPLLARPEVLALDATGNQQQPKRREEKKLVLHDSSSRTVLTILDVRRDRQVRPAAPSMQWEN